MPLIYSRYSSIAFPPYRFVPGRFPHPIAHPEGHSYRAPGAAEPVVALIPPERWRESADYLYGCDLYNHGYWWEAHEAWEGLWRVVPNPSVQRSFLQGLIQVAAGQMQVHLGKVDGVRRLRETSQRHLDVVLAEVAGDAYMGLSLSDWVSEVDRYWALILGRPEIFHDDASYPYLRIAIESDNS